MPNSQLDTTILPFYFRDIAEVLAAIDQNFSGSLQPEQLIHWLAKSADGIPSDLTFKLWNVYKWKVDLLRKSNSLKMRDTWLTKPYEPRVTARNLP
jgi:hypothetical protein